MRRKFIDRKGRWIFLESAKEIVKKISGYYICLADAEFADDEEMTKNRKLQCGKLLFSD